MCCPEEAGRRSAASALATNAASASTFAICRVIFLFCSEIDHTEHAFLFCSPRFQGSGSRNQRLCGEESYTFARVQTVVSWVSRFTDFGCKDCTHLILGHRFHHRKKWLWLKAGINVFLFGSLLRFCAYRCMRRILRRFSNPRADRTPGPRKETVRRARFFRRVPLRLHRTVWRKESARSRNSGSRRSRGNGSGLSGAHFSQSLFDRNWALSGASRNRRHEFLRPETQTAIRLQ